MFYRRRATGSAVVGDLVGFGALRARHRRRDVSLVFAKRRLRVLASLRKLAELFLISGLDLAAGCLSQLSAMASSRSPSINAARWSPRRIDLVIAGDRYASRTELRMCLGWSPTATARASIES
jgi:hypothetical protein